MLASRTKVLLVGWEAADWHVIDPLLKRGQMPHLARLLARGVRGKLASLEPTVAPLLWTSIATGKTANEHGVLAFVEPRPDGSGIRPIGSGTRRCKALWNILAENDLQSTIVGWYATHPAETIAGTVVADQFFQFDPAADVTSLAASAGTASPSRLIEALSPLRVGHADLGAGDLEPFVRGLAEIDLQHDGRPARLAAILARTLSVHAVTTWLQQHEAWDFAAVCFPGIDRIGRVFMPYHPPRLPQVDPADFARYCHVVTAFYQFSDLLLGTLVALAGADAHVLLVSDHGFESGTLRPVGSASRSPACWHRKYGVAVLAGPLVRPDAQLYGANLLDVAPTVLALLGLPVGQDMRGRPWSEALHAGFAWDVIRSWDSPHDGGPSGSAATSAEPAAEDAVALRQLIELGYLEDDDDSARQIARAERDAELNLAYCLSASRDPARGIPHWEALVSRYPDEASYALELARCYLRASRMAAARELIERRVAPTLDPVRRAAIGAQLETAARQPHAALAYLDEVDVQEGPPSLAASLSLLRGQAYCQLAQWEDAQGAFAAVLALDPDHARALAGLSTCAAECGRWSEALDYALRSLRLQYWQPRVHVQLGICLAQLGRSAEAIDAFQTALRQAPYLRRAHVLLADAYEATGAHPGLVAQHRLLASEESANR
jgi:tetratricopeptide (TPR) repeat protein